MVSIHQIGMSQFISSISSSKKIKCPRKEGVQEFRYKLDVQVFKFFAYGYYPLRITQQFGTVAKQSVPSSLNLSQPYVCQKALAEKYRQPAQPVL